MSGPRQQLSPAQKLLQAKRLCTKEECRGTKSGGESTGYPRPLYLDESKELCYEHYQEELEASHAAAVDRLRRHRGKG